MVVSQAKKRSVLLVLVLAFCAVIGVSYRFSVDADGSGPAEVPEMESTGLSELQEGDGAELASAESGSTFMLHVGVEDRESGAIAGATVFAEYMGQEMQGQSDDAGDCFLEFAMVGGQRRVGELVLNAKGLGYMGLCKVVSNPGGRKIVLVLDASIELMAEVYSYRSGEPIVRAHVLAVDSKEQVAETNFDGSFAFDLAEHPVGSTWLLEAEGHVDQIVHVGKSDEGNRFALFPGFDIGGRIVDHDGRGLGGVKVSNSLGQFVVTGRDGEFDVQIVEEVDGQGEMRISAADIVDLRFAISPTRDVSLRPGRWKDGRVEIQAARYARIRLISPKIGSSFGLPIEGPVLWRLGEGLSDKGIALLNAQPFAVAEFEKNGATEHGKESSPSELLVTPWAWQLIVTVLNERGRPVGKGRLKRTPGPGQVADLVIEPISSGGTQLPPRARARVSGTVAFNGRPFSGRGVHWTNIDNNDSGWLEVDDGRFDGFVTAGSVRLRLVLRFRAGFGTDYTKYLAHDPKMVREVEIASGEALDQSFDIELEEGWIRGRVVASNSSSGVANAQVQLRGGRLVLSGVTSPSGGFAFLVPKTQPFHIYVNNKGVRSELENVLAGDVVEIIEGGSVKIEVSLADAGRSVASDGWEVYWSQPGLAKWTPCQLVRDHTKGDGFSMRIADAPIDLFFMGDAQGYEPVLVEKYEASHNGMMLTVQTRKGGTIEVNSASAHEQAIGKYHLISEQHAKAVSQYRGAAYWRHEYIPKVFPGKSIRRRRVRFGEDGRALITGLPPGRYQLIPNIGSSESWPKAVYELGSGETKSVVID